MWEILNNNNNNERKQHRKRQDDHEDQKDLWIKDNFLIDWKNENNLYWVQSFSLYNFMINMLLLNFIANYALSRLLLYTYYIVFQ